MRKLLLVMMVLLAPMVMDAKKKVKYVYEYDYYVKSTTDIRTKSFKDSRVRVYFDWYSTNILMSIRICNDTGARMVIEWENARIRGNKVDFYGDDINRDLIPIPDEVVFSEDSSNKTLMIRDKYSYYPIFYLKDLRNVGDSTTTTFIIPIRFGDEIVDYKIEVVAYVKAINQK